MKIKVTAGSIEDAEQEDLGLCYVERIHIGGHEIHVVCPSKDCDYNKRMQARVDALKRHGYRIVDGSW